MAFERMSGVSQKAMHHGICSAQRLIFGHNCC